MAKPISSQINRAIVTEYAKGKLSQKKLALALGVSTAHVFRILKRERSLSNPSGRSSAELLTKEF